MVRDEADGLRELGESDCRPQPQDLAMLRLEDFGDLYGVGQMKPLPVVVKDSHDA